MAVRPRSVPAAGRADAAQRTVVATIRSAVVHPGQVFDELATRPVGPGSGFAITAAVGTLYALVAAGLALLGHEPMVAPWLRIPPDRYYEVQALFTVPVVLATVIAGAGACHLTGRLMGSRTAFDQWWVAVAIAYALPTLLMWAVEAVTVVLLLTTPLTVEQWSAATSNGLGAVLVASYQYVAFAWYAVLFVLAAHRVGRLSLLRALPVAVAGIATIGLLQFTFIR